MKNNDIKEIPTKEKKVKNIKEKESTKHIRFNYLQAFLVRATDIIDADTNNTPLPNSSALTKFDMEPLLLSIKDNSFSKNTTLLINEDNVEFEPKTISEKIHESYYFQLSKLRVTDIPSKKKIGKIREEIMLADDEFIGEFTSIIYDTKISGFMIQSNKYGLSLAHLEKYFSELRINYNAFKEKEEDDYFIKFYPIIDPNKLKNLPKSKYFRKLTIKGSSLSLDNFKTPNIFNVNKVLQDSGSNRFEFSISSDFSKDSSLDIGFIKNFIKDYTALKNVNKPIVEITRKETDDSNVELINFIEPRFFDTISLKVKARETIGHEYMKSKMFEKYNNTQSKIWSLFPNIKGVKIENL